MLQHVRIHNTNHHVLTCNLHLHSTALVQFTNGSYPFTLAAGPPGTQTCVNINTLDNHVQEGLKVFNVSIGLTTSTGSVVNVGTPSTAQVTIVDTTGRRGVFPTYDVCTNGGVSFLQSCPSRFSMPLLLWQRMAMQHKCVFRRWVLPLRALLSP